MSYLDFTRTHRRVGMFSAWVLTTFLISYALTLLMGLISLKSPQDPIADPFFTILEMLIVLMMPFMILVMISLHAYAAKDMKVYSLSALIMMILTTAITTSVHFSILTLSRHTEFTKLPWLPLLLSFQWPSIAYTLDILAWDWFFALAMLFGAFAVKSGKLESYLRVLMLLSGFLSLIGLVGVPLADMQIRMIGVVGYVALTPFLFLILGFVFRRTQV